MHVVFRYSIGGSGESGSHGISNNQTNSNGHSQGRHSLGSVKGKTTPSKPVIISTAVAVESPEPVAELALQRSPQTVTEGLAMLELPAVVAASSPIKIVSIVLGTPGGKKRPSSNVLPKLCPCP